MKKERKEQLFTINPCIKKYQKPLPDWFIIVNGHKCLCNKSIAEESSPIIQNFLKNQKNEDLFFAIEIPNISDTSINSLLIMISKIFCGEEIDIQDDNYQILLLIGKHFVIHDILNKIEEYRYYVKKVTSYFKNSNDFKKMIKLEKILLFEMNESNIETKVKEYESLIKKIPINCFINFVINICTKNYKINKIDSNEFLIEIIKNVNKIVPEALPHFLSIIYHKFIVNNSKLNNGIDKYNKKEINSLIHQIFIDDLMRKIDENIRFNQHEVIVPNDLQQYFSKKGDFYELSKENNQTNNIITFKEINMINNNGEKKDQFFSYIELIINDNIDSFQNYLVSSQIDINCRINIDIIKKVSFIDEKEISLIELSALYGSVQCFSCLYNKQVKINKNRLSFFAVVGENPEIIHICEREECVFNEKALDISIEYHRHQITKWLVETKKIIPNERNLRSSIINYNIKTIRYLVKKGIKIDKILIFICESNNIILFKWLADLLNNYELKIIYQENNRSALHIACEQNNVEIVKFLVSRDEIDINSNSDVIFLKLIFLGC